MGKDVPTKDLIENEYLIDTDEFKETITILMKDFVGIKKDAIEIGYTADAIKLRDYIDYYVRLNE